MATGAAWVVDTDKMPVKPWARFDINAVRDIPVEWDTWFTDIGSVYASHSIITASPLVVVGSSQAAGVIKVRMTTDGSGTLGTKYPFTVRVVALNGEQDDQTLWLKLVQR